MRRLLDIVTSPVLGRELRSGLRERRILVIQTVFVSCLAGITLLVLLGQIDSSQPRRPVLLPGAGQTILLWSFAIQWMMVVLVAPSLTCGLISSEREKKTYEMLVASLLTPAQIVGGKLLFGLSYVAYLLVSSVPVTATVFFLGGVTPAEVAVLYGLVLLSGLLVCQIALFLSARETRTATATNQSYGLTFLLMIFGMILAPSYIALHSMGRGGSGDDLLLSTFKYLDLSIPYLALPIMTVLWLSAFLFLKTMHCVRNAARHVLWMQRLFLFWSLGAVFLTTAMVCAQLGPSGGSHAEDVGGFLATMLLGLLFFNGLLTNPPRLVAVRDRLRYAMSMTARRLFFPVYLMLLCALACGMLWGHGLATLALLGSFGIAVCMLLGLFGGARALVALSGGRLPHPVAYFVLLGLSLLSPLLQVLTTPYERPLTSTWTFYFASPFTATMSLWSHANPQFVDLGGAWIPMADANCAFFGIVALLGSAIAWRKGG